MGFFQSLFESGNPSTEPASEPTIDLPEDEYTVARPVAVRRSQLASFQAVINADRETPVMDGPGAEFLIESINDAWAETMPSGDTWEESVDRPRLDAESIITSWRESISDDVDVIFLSVGCTWRLGRFLEACEIRADNSDDPFTLPDEFADAAALLAKLRAAEDEEESVIVHTDQLPTVSRDQ